MAEKEHGDEAPPCVPTLVRQPLSEVLPKETHEMDSRPQISDDNSLSESIFKMLEYRRGTSARFVEIDDARA